MELSAVRMPAVAGRFYSSEPAALAREVRDYLGPRAERPMRVLGILVPHAGHVYSGGVCGRALSGIALPERVLLLHTKHCPGGGPLTLSRHRAWRTPLGDLAASAELTAALAELPSVTVSDEPHVQEHAAEVVLPFLCVLQPSIEIAVISVGAQSAAALERAASEIEAALAPYDRLLVVASSDMNHYEDRETTLTKDAHALAALERGDAEGLLAVCEREAISMCGVHATALMLKLCRRRGGSRVRLLEHTTSAEVSGDHEHTVGYASACVL